MDEPVRRTEHVLHCLKMKVILGGKLRLITYAKTKRNQQKPRKQQFLKREIGIELCKLGKKMLYTLCWFSFFSELTQKDVTDKYMCPKH